MALNNVPLTGQSLGVTRVPINQNFSVIDTAFSVDHVSYNVTNQGMHNKISFPTQSGAPAPVAGVVQLYSIISPFTGQPELFFGHQSGSTAPFGAATAEFTSAGWTNPGWARLPSGILIKWANGIGFGGMSSITINLNATTSPASPSFLNLLSIFTSTIDSNASYNNVIGVISKTNPNLVTIGKFGGSNPGSSVTVGYLAIGY